jgi:ankyrin repeat protein
MKQIVKLITVILFTFIQTAAGQQTSEIHKAVIAGDLNKVRALIDSDPTLLESKDNEGDTPLIKACLNKQTRTRQPAIAKFLIEKGADVLRARNIPVNHPETRIAGDRFHYVRK